MKNFNLKNLQYIAANILNILCIISVTTFSGFAQTVTSETTPSTAMPDPGDMITVSINIDMSAMAAPDDKLGSFTGTLNWDPAVLSYVSNSGILSGFIGNVNDANASTGMLTFNGINASGISGNIIVLDNTFDAVGGANTNTVLDLEYSAMAAAITFTDLLSFLTVKDTVVTIQPNGIEDILAGAAPKEFVLFQNYPNPTNTVTHIPFGLPKISDVTIEIYNLSGELITTVTKKQMSVGYHVIDVDAAQLTDDLYFYRIQADEFTQFKKMVVLK